MNRGLRWMLVATFFLAGLSAWGQQTLNNVPAALVSYPDLILHNGKIATMNDPALNNSLGRFVQAMAVRGDRIQFVGSEAEVLALAGPQTRKIDLKGRTVTPGLINTHVHLHDAAVNNWARRNPQKVEAVRKTFEVTGRTFSDLTKGIELVIKEQMAHPLPEQWAWIQLPTGQSGTGIGIDYLDKKVMDRAKLDQLAPKLPVFVGAHPEFIWNTAARNAFLGWYEVEPTDENEQNAITIDTTMGRSLIADFYFDKHMKELADVIADYLKYQAVGGFTTFSSHIVGLRKMPAYMQLVSEGRMPIRFAFSNRNCQQVEPDIPGCFLRAGDFAGLGDRNNYFWNIGLTLGGIDNGPPAHCTTLEAPAVWKAKEDCILKPGNAYYKAVYAAIRSRYRYVVNHSWGDKALDYVLDIVDQVMKDNPENFNLEFVKSRRYSSDHCGFWPSPSQLPRMGKYGWYISCDAGALTRSAPYFQIYGIQNAHYVAPVKSSLAAGIVPSLEANGYDLSEDPEAEPVHLEGMALITRKNRWGDPIAPQEAIDRETLMKMSTVWPSYYVMREKELGTLEPGKFADYVVWNKDYFTVPLDQLGTVYPVMTVLGGKTAVLREEFAKELGVPAAGPQAKFIFTLPKPDPVDMKKLLEESAGGEG